MANFEGTNRGGCPLCKKSERDLAHFIFSCGKLSEPRKKYMSKIRALDPKLKSGVFSIDQLFSNSNLEVLTVFAEYLHVIKNQLLN